VEEMGEVPEIVSQLKRCLPWIEAALEYSGGTHTPSDIAVGVLNGTMQLWPAERACAVTEIVVYPNKKVLHVFLAAGEMDQIVDMQKSAEAWGKAQDCTAMTIAGRKGWSKVLKDHGYEEKFVTLAKEI
jgi:hypothetical protein